MDILSVLTWPYREYSLLSSVLSYIYIFLIISRCYIVQGPNINWYMYITTRFWEIFTANVETFKVPIVSYRWVIFWTLFYKIGQSVKPTRVSNLYRNDKTVKYRQSNHWLMSMFHILKGYFVVWQEKRTVEHLIPQYRVPNSKYSSK